MTSRAGRYQGSGDDWDAFVRSREGWTHFHLYGWKRVIEDVHGHECIYVAARDLSGAITAVLPLVRVRSPVFGHFLVSMPFLNYGGPLGTSSGTRAVSAEAVRICREEEADLLELRSRESQEIDLPASHRKITVLKELPMTDPEVLWDDLPSKVRSQVRKPRREGVQVRFGRDQMEGFWKVYSLHMRNLGTPVQPREWFESIADAPRRRADSVRVRAGVVGRGGNDVGVRPLRVPEHRAEHAPLLGLHGAGHRSRAVRLQLRPVHAGQRHPSLQEAVGHQGSEALVVSAGLGWHREDSLARGRHVALGAEGVAESASAGGQPGRSGRRPVHSLIGRPGSVLRRQLPVYSPLSARAVASGVAASVLGGAVARRQVRDALRQEWGVEELLLTDSGTSALTLALRSISADRPDQPVALPAYSCYDVATAAVGADVPVVTYDLDPATLSPDRESVRNLAREGLAALVVAHLYGIPAELDPLLELADEAGIPVVEDAAQAAGGLYRGRPLGTFGSLAVLSFGRGKGTTGSGGGALLAADASGRRWLARARRSLDERTRRGVNQIPSMVGQWLFGRPALYAVPYREPKSAARISALSAGTLRTTLTLRDEEREHRRRVARRLRSAVQPLDAIRAIRAPGDSEAGYLRFPILAEEEAARRLRGRRAESLGVMPGYPKILERLPALQRRCRNRSTARPGAESLVRQLFTLPTHSRLTSSDLSGLESLLRAACRYDSSSDHTEWGGEASLDGDPTAELRRGREEGESALRRAAMSPDDG